MNNFKILMKYSWKNKFMGKAAKVTLILMALLFIIAPIAITLVVELVEKPIDIGIYSEMEANSNTFIELLNEQEDFSDKYNFVYVVDTRDEEYDFIVNIDEFNIFSRYDNAEDILPIQTYLSNIKQIEFLQENNLDLDFLNNYYESSIIEIVYDEDHKDNSAYFFISYFSAIAIFMILTFVIQLIGAEISEEKSSRAMEIMMTSCSPTKHMLSKIITNVGYILLYILIIIVSLFIGLGINNLYLGNSFFDFSFINAFIEMLGQDINILFVITIIVLFISTMLITSTLAAAIASTVVSPSDFAKSIAPLTMLLLVPYMITIFALPDAIMQPLSFIPLFSMFIYPTLMLKLSLPVITTIIVLFINVAFTVLAIVYAGKLYKFGVLNYSGAPLKQIIKDAIKANKKVKK